MQQDDRETPGPPPERTPGSEHIARPAPSEGAAPPSDTPPRREVTILAGDLQPGDRFVLQQGRGGIVQQIDDDPDPAFIACTMANGGQGRLRRTEPITVAARDAAAFPANSFRDPADDGFRAAATVIVIDLYGVDDTKADTQPREELIAEVMTVLDAGWVYLRNDSHEQQSLCFTDGNRVAKLQGILDEIRPAQPETITPTDDASRAAAGHRHEPTGDEVHWPIVSAINLLPGDLIVSGPDAGRIVHHAIPRGVDDLIMVEYEADEHGPLKVTMKPAAEPFSIYRKSDHEPTGPPLVETSTGFLSRVSETFDPAIETKDVSADDVREGDFVHYHGHGPAATVQKVSMTAEDLVRIDFVDGASIGAPFDATFTVTREAEATEVSGDRRDTIVLVLDDPPRELETWRDTFQQFRDADFVIVRAKPAQVIKDRYGATPRELTEEDERILADHDAVISLAEPKTAWSSGPDVVSDHGFVKIDSLATEAMRGDIQTMTAGELRYALPFTGQETGAPVTIKLVDGHVVKVKSITRTDGIVILTPVDDLQVVLPLDIREFDPKDTSS